LQIKRKREFKTYKFICIHSVLITNSDINPTNIYTKKGCLKKHPLIIYSKFNFLNYFLALTPAEPTVFQTGTTTIAD